MSAVTASRSRRGSNRQSTWAQHWPYADDLAGDLEAGKSETRPHASSPGAAKDARHQVDVLDGPVADDVIVFGIEVAGRLGRSGVERRRLAVGIEVRVAEARDHRLDGPRRGPQGILVRSRLEDIGTTVLSAISLTVAPGP